MLVKNIMKEPFIVNKDINLTEAAKIMSSKSIGSIIFVLKNRAKGIVTESDLLKNFGKNKRISEIMSKNIINISQEENIDGALKLMKDNNIKRLPVIDKEKNLVGIVTMTDIAANCDKLEEEFLIN